MDRNDLLGKLTGLGGLGEFAAEITDRIMAGERRELHIREIGYVRVDERVSAFLAKHGPWLEIGAGTGALAHGIKLAGGRIVATDDFSWKVHRERPATGSVNGRRSITCRARGLLLASQRRPASVCSCHGPIWTAWRSTPQPS